MAATLTWISAGDGHSNEEALGHALDAHNSTLPCFAHIASAAMNAPPATSLEKPRPSKTEVRTAQDYWGSLRLVIRQFCGIFVVAIFR